MSSRILRGLVCLGLALLVSAQDVADVTISATAHRDEKTPSDDVITPEKSEPSTPQPKSKDETSVPNSTVEATSSGEDVSRTSGNSTASSFVTSKAPVASGLTNSRSVLDCYSCLNCSVARGNAITRKCAASTDPRRPNLCIAYTIMYRGSDLRLRARGCTQDLGTCRGIEQSLATQRIIQIENCLECSGNLCNSSHALGAAIFSLVALVFTATVAKTIVL